MNKNSYLKIMQAIVNLMIVIMIEAGGVARENASKIGENVLRAITGGSIDKNDKK